MTCPLKCTRKTSKEPRSATSNTSENSPSTSGVKCTAMVELACTGRCPLGGSKAKRLPNAVAGEATAQSAGMSPLFSSCNSYLCEEVTYTSPTSSTSYAKTALGPMPTPRSSSGRRRSRPVTSRKAVMAYSAAVGGQKEMVNSWYDCAHTVPEEGSMEKAPSVNDSPSPSTCRRRLRYFRSSADSSAAVARRRSSKPSSSSSCPIPAWLPPASSAARAATTSGPAASSTAVRSASANSANCTSRR